MDEIQSLMVDVSFAGSDTTSTSLTWFVLYMVLHPDIQEKVQSEINLIAKNDRLPNWNDSEKMPYLQANLCGVQKSSGLTGVAGSTGIRDMKIGGYHGSQRNIRGT